MTEFYLVGNPGNSDDIIIQAGTFRLRVSVYHDHHVNIDVYKPYRKFGYEVTPIIAYRGDNTAYLKMTSHKSFSWKIVEILSKTYLKRMVLVCIVTRTCIL